MWEGASLHWALVRGYNNPVLVLFLFFVVICSLINVVSYTFIKVCILIILLLSRHEMDIDYIHTLVHTHLLSQRECYVYVSLLPVFVTFYLSEYVSLHSLWYILDFLLIIVNKNMNNKICLKAEGKEGKKVNCIIR